MFLTPLQKIDTRNLSEDELMKLVDKNKNIYTDFFDFDYLKSLIDNICIFFDKFYFRSRFIGFESIPERNNPDRPLIYASNHSGMAFPWDAMMFGAGLLQLNNLDQKKSIRGLTAPMLSQTKLMHPYLIDDLWKRAGGVDATSLNFETMMQYQDSNLLIYPEGVPGIGKGFDKKYQLQRFSTSFIRMSIKYKTDVIPVSTVNAEYINPYSYNSTTVTRLVNKIGMPFLPLGLSLLLVPLQPWAFYMAFPANLTYVRGKTIKPYEMVDKPFDELCRDDFVLIAEKVKEQMQEDLNKAVEKYGKHPYKTSGLIKIFIKNLSKIPYILPSGWALMFLEHERLFTNGNGKPVKMKITFFSWIIWLFRNPQSLFFYIPFLGWIPLIIQIARKKN